MHTTLEKALEIVNKKAVRGGRNKRFRILYSGLGEELADALIKNGWTSSLMAIWVIAPKGWKPNRDKAEQAN